METNEKKFNTLDLVKRIIAFLFVSLGISLIATLISDPLYNALSSIYQDQELINQTNLYLNFICYFVAFIVTVALLFKDELMKTLKGFMIPKNVKDGLAIGVVILAVTMSYNLIINLFDIGSNQNEQAVDSMITINPLISFFTVGIFGPIVEEIGYRYGLFGSIKKFSRIGAYIVTVLVFALIHFNLTPSMTSEEIIIEFLNLPTYLFSAFMLSYAYENNDSLTTSIVAHGVNKLTSVIFSVLAMLLA